MSREDSVTFVPSIPPFVLSLMEPKVLRRFRSALLAWYERHGRDLPWRRSADAYRIWVSEIMLQQTTVTAVVPYFERFFGRFPTLKSLADAEEQDVLRHWEGLGYYSRARNLHKAARLLMSDYHGEFPQDVERLNQLPGVGRYTAGAIASFAFNLRAPIVEANTLRLYCRLLGFEGDPRSAAGQKLLWGFAEEILPADGAGQLNQALMDLGATICTPRSPRCGDCPIQFACQAYGTHTQETIPAAARRPEPTYQTHAAVAVQHEGRWLLRRMRPGERWAGLWDFPRCELQNNSREEHDVERYQLSNSRRLEIEEAVRAQTGVAIQLVREFHQIRHTVTRFQIRLVCYSAQTAPPEGGSNPTIVSEATSETEILWVKPEEFPRLPFSMTGRKVARRIAQACSAEDASESRKFDHPADFSSRPLHRGGV